MHEVLVNRLGGLSLPRKSVVRLTDRPNMTLDVYRGRIKQQCNNNNNLRLFAKVLKLEVYLDPNEMSGRSYLCTCPQTILLFDKENRICTLLNHR